MATIIIDNEESILINVTEDNIYNNPCAKSASLTLDLEDYYNKNKDLKSTVFSSDEDEDEEIYIRKPQAPPPSPQQKPMLDFFFSKKLNEELEAFIIDKEPTHDPLVKHAKILDKLLRNKDHHCIYKKKPLKKTPFKHLLKATKNKKQEDVINQFKEMGL